MNKGQSLFEVVVALFIITLIIIAVVSLSTVSIANSLFSKNKTLSARYSQEGVEWLRSQREEDPVSFFTILPGIYCLDTTTFTNTGNCTTDERISNTVFIRELNLTSTQEASKTIVSATVTTFWTDAKGRHEASSSTVFTDRREQ